MRWTTWVAFPLSVALAGNSRPPNALAQAMAHESVLYSSKGNVVLFDETKKSLAHSSDGGLSWVPNVLTQVNNVWLDNNDDNTMFAITNTGVAKSGDGGNHWTVTEPSFDSVSLDKAGAEVAKGSSNWITFNFNDGIPLLYQGSKFESIPPYQHCVPHSSDPVAVCMSKDALHYCEDRGVQWITPDIEGIQDATMLGVQSTSSGYFVASMKLADDSVRVIVSSNGVNWTPVKFESLNTLPPGSVVSVVDIFDESVALAIGDPESSARDLWTQSASGDVFTKQLEHVVESNGVLDIQGVSFAPGTLFANAYVGRFHKHHKTVASVNSRVSFDSGRTWQQPQATLLDGSVKDIHLHSNIDNTPGDAVMAAAPGLLSAFGHVGSQLGSIEHAKPFLSTDGGISWKEIEAPKKHGPFVIAANGAVMLNFAHKKGSVLVSLDSGKTWEPIAIAKNTKNVKSVYVSPRDPYLVLVQSKDAIEAVDLSTLLDGECGEGSIEKLKTDCKMGARYSYLRAKEGASCFVSNHAWQHSEDCACELGDYECDRDFVRQDGKCVPNSLLENKLKTCRPGSNVIVSSGYDRLPGNRCDRKTGVNFTLSNYECDEKDLKATAEVTSQIFELEGRLENYMYLKTGDNREEETVLAWTTNGQLVISHDQGGEWQSFGYGQIEKVWSNPYFNDYVLVYTRKRELYASTDRAVNFKKINLPGPINLFGSPFSFHSTEGGWLLASVIRDDCDSPDSCLPAVYATLNFGSNWQKLGDDMMGCTFVGNLLFDTEKSLIFCEQRVHNQFNLISSSDWFKTITTNAKNTYGFALDDAFLVTVAQEIGSDVIRPQVSVDGRTFASARIPPDISLDKDTGYTVIDTLTKSVFLAVTTNTRHGQEMSTLLKSNANGTEYASILADVNRDMIGLIDFEKIRSTEGVALANIVWNADDIRQRGERKLIKSMISHSDGALWDFVTPPEGECRGKSRADCSLHLHGFTERIDLRNKPFSPSAVGLIIANGNTGDSLLSLHDASTYFSRDGGFSFSRISERPSFWEYGDSGSIIVIVPRGEPTNTLSYSLNEGKDWIQYQFSDPMVSVLNIASIPSDTSRKFLLFAQPPQSDGLNTQAIQVDFRQLADRQCVYEGPNNKKDDFELWIPSHPQRKNDCLFGHVSQYYRKIPDRNCYIGKVGKKLGEPIRILKNCECTRDDYECDFNYSLASDGTCKAVESSEPLDMDAQCSVPGAIAWHKVTGYRRIPIDSCVDGQQLDGGGDRPCPGKEAEFEEKYGRKPGSSPGRGGSPSQPSDGPSVFRILISVFFVLIIIGTLAVVLTYKFRSQGRIYLGEIDEPSTALDRFAVTAASIAANAGQQLLRVWDAFIGNLDSRFRSSHINLYERIDSEERSRILDSDLEDDDLNDDLDNPELGEDLDLDVGSD